MIKRSMKIPNLTSDLKQIDANMSWNLKELGRILITKTMHRQIIENKLWKLKRTFVDLEQMSCILGCHARSMTKFKDKLLDGY